MESFYEESIYKADMRTNRLLYGIMLAFVAVSAVFAVLSLIIFTLIFGFFTGFFTAAVFGIMALVFNVFKDRQIIEYDYVYLEGILTVAKVINNKKRVEIISVSTDEITALGRIDDGKFERIKQNAKIINSYLNPDNPLYYCAMQQNGNNTILVFEPSFKMLDMISSSNKLLRGYKNG
ncbi:MAG TPA: hypothetical protein PLZ84_01910 [Clostridia bacterium]|nr:hypothetical protein [Clostridia bacterium]